MKRSLYLPATVSLGAHAFLLFGFTSSERLTLAKAAPPEVHYTPIEIVVPEDEHEPEDEVPGTPRTEPAVRVPVSPEPLPPVKSAGIEMPMPPRVDVPVDGIAADRIPSSWMPAGERVGRPGPPVIPSHLLDNPPVARHRVAPAYPFAAKRAGRSGEVLVEFVVNERGEVLAPRVVRSSEAEFEEPTLRAVAKWRFEPGRRDGRPVRFRMSVPIIFSLHE